MTQKTDTQTVKQKKPLTIEEVKKKVEKTAKKILEFTKIEYVQTETYPAKGDRINTYIIYRLYNKTYNCWNSATYDVNCDAIDFRIHRVTSL